LSSEHFKLISVKRVGLPESFVKKRCTTCPRNEGIYIATCLHPYQNGMSTYIVYCECELGVCPYIGKGYIYRGNTAIEKAKECVVKRV
jgi:hypothetical protein